MRKTAALWIRVSSEPQSKGYTPAEYEKRAIAAAKSLDLNVVRTFSVTESAKISEERKNFREMVDFIKANKVDFLIADEIDRITRHYRDTYIIQDLIDAHGLNIHFVATGRTISKSSPSQDHFMFSLMADWRSWTTACGGRRRALEWRAKSTRAAFPAWPQLAI
jgi:DNA invertase Pin-like site-specific DNA recombinase